MTDKTLKEAVERELEWEPRINGAHIGVAAKDGAVTLTGDVSTYSEKIAARKAAEHIAGVRAIADDIEVKVPTSSKRDDTQIAEAAVHHLSWNNLVPSTVHAEVQHGFVTLDGEVEWPYQRREAEKAVRNLAGMHGLSNQITVKPRVQPRAVKEKISAALQRDARLDAARIRISVSDGTVHLEGNVHSLTERHAARAAAEDAPGVVYVDDQITVSG